MSHCDCNLPNNDSTEKRILILLLSINATMFFLELGFGVISESSALIADSIDMLADAMVYAIALYAVGKPAIYKIRSASISGIFQITLGILVFFDIVRRAIYGSEPHSFLMIIVGVAALIANVICLKIISRQRHGDIHMRASWIFSRNDVIANLGTILGGCLVYLLDSRYPDLIIGIAISIIVIYGGIQILGEARKSMNEI